MTAEEKERDFIKENLKGLYEYLRICALFIAGLTTSGVSLLFRGDFNVNSFTVWVVLFNFIAFLVVAIYLLKILFAIDNELSKLKNI